MQRKLLLVIGLITLFLVTFVIALFLAFPTDSIRYYAESSLNNMMKGKQLFEIKELSISPALNVTVKKITMKPSTVEVVPDYMMVPEGEYSGYFCTKSVESMPFIIDEIFVSPKAWKTLSGLPEGTFSINVSGGEIKGKLISTRLTEDGEEDSEQAVKEEQPEEEKETARSKKKTKKTDAEDKKTDKADKKQPSMISKKKKTIPTLMSVNAKGNRIDLSKFAWLSNVTGAQFYGEFDFDTRAKIEANKLKDLHLNMNVLSTALCPKRIQSKSLPMPITVPFMILGDIEGEITIQNDVVKIVKLTNTGPDVIFDVQGTISLPVGNVKEPDFNLSIKISPAEEWLEANEWDGIYQICRKQDDGSIELKLSGKASKLKPNCGKPIPVTKTSSDTKKSTAVEKKPETNDSAADTKPDVPEKKATPPEKPSDKKDDNKKKSVNNLGETFHRQLRQDPDNIENDLRHSNHRELTQEEMDRISSNPRAQRAMREVEAAAAGDLRMKRTGHREELSDVDFSNIGDRFPKRDHRGRRPSVE